MKKNLFMVLSAACLLAACSNNDELQSGGQNEAINATATLAGVTNTPVSRGIVDGLPASGSTLAVAFARLDQTGKNDVYPADYTGVAAASPATIDNAGKVVFNPVLYYLTNDEIGKTKLVGWYPSTGTYNAGTVTFTIDGKTDVLLSNEKAGSRNNKFGTNDFTFAHKLTQIVVKAYASDAVSAGADGKWGKISKIEVLNQPNTCTLTLPATVATAGTPANVAIALKNADADMPEATLEQKTSSTEAVEMGYAIIAPTTDKTLKLKVTTSTNIEQEVTVTLPQSAGADQQYLAGKKYTVVLKFSVAGIEPAGTAITAWSEEGVVNPDEITM
ncbi:fimbrillin family protein [Bacteroides sp.]